MIEELVHLASQFLYKLLLCVNFALHHLNAAVGCLLAFGTLFEAFRAVKFHIVAYILIMSKIFSWKIRCSALHRTRDADGPAVVLNVGNQFLIGHLSFLRVVFQ